MVKMLQIDTQKDLKMNAFASNGSSGKPLIEGTTEGKLCPACSKLSSYIEDELQWHNIRCGLANRERLMRIHIVGGPGSGKTTLAHKIGTRLEIKVHELDLVAFTGPDYAPRQLSERLADVSKILNQRAWITEGLFILWTEKLLDCADIIVWLDNVNWERSIWRTVKRFTRSALQEAKHRRGLGKFARFHDYARHLKQLIDVFFSSREYFSTSPSPRASQIESRENTAQHLAFYKDKVIHCYNDDGVEAFVDYVSYCCSC
jgi:adenylate kinase family enzyme